MHRSYGVQDIFAALLLSVTLTQGLGARDARAQALDGQALQGLPSVAAPAPAPAQVLALDCATSELVRYDPLSGQALDATALPAPWGGWRRARAMVAHHGPDGTLDALILASQDEAATQPEAINLYRLDVASGHVQPLTARPQAAPSAPLIAMSGRVLERTGHPVPGALVTAAGVAHQTLSDQDGHYQIEVPEGDVMIFAHHGERDLWGMVELLSQRDEAELVAIPILGALSARGGYDRPSILASSGMTHQAAVWAIAPDHRHLARVSWQGDALELVAAPEGAHDVDVHPSTGHLLVSGPQGLRRLDPEAAQPLALRSPAGVRSARWWGDSSVLALAPGAPGAPGAQGWTLWRAGPDSAPQRVAERPRTAVAGLPQPPGAQARLDAISHDDRWALVREPGAAWLVDLEAPLHEPPRQLGAGCDPTGDAPCPDLCALTFTRSPPSAGADAPADGGLQAEPPDAPGEPLSCSPARVRAPAPSPLSWVGWIVFWVMIMARLAWTNRRAGATLR